MALSQVKKVSISDQVFDQIKQQIIDREWLPGERLPSEAELCHIFGVSRVSIRQALQKLAVLGLVETRFGEGSYVKSVDLGQQMKATLLPSAYLQPHTIDEMFEFRSVVEVETAGLAAERVTPEDIAHLKELYEMQIDEETRTLQSFSDCDAEFHMTLARSTGNKLIITIYEILWDIYRTEMAQAVRCLGFSGAYPYHQQLIEAMEERDAHKASSVMKAHMDNNIELYRQYINSGAAEISS